MSSIPTAIPRTTSKRQAKTSPSTPSRKKPAPSIGEEAGSLADFVARTTAASGVEYFLDDRAVMEQIAQVLS